MACNQEHAALVALIAAVQPSGGADSHSFSFCAGFGEAKRLIIAALAAGASPPLAGQAALRGQVNAASDSLLAVAVAYENGHGIDADLLARTARAEGERLEAALAVSSAGAGEAQPCINCGGTEMAPELMRSIEDGNIGPFCSECWAYVSTWHGGLDEKRALPILLAALRRVQAERARTVSIAESQPISW